jgi:transaldolase
LPIHYNRTHADTNTTVKVDIDCIDPAEAKRFLPFKPYDQTSNQRLVYEQMISPENRELFLETVEQGKDEGWEVILNRMVCEWRRRNEC